MKALLTVVMVLLTLTGCIHSYFCCPEEPDYYEQYHVNIPAMEYVTITYAGEMEREKGLFLEDSYACYDDYIEKSLMWFSSMRLVDMCEGRDLIVYLVEGYLARINEHDQLPYELYNYPFTADNLFVQINFDSFYGFYVDGEYIGRIVLENGWVHYYAFNSISCDSCWNQRSERYDQAVRFSKARERCGSHRKKRPHHGIWQEDPSYDYNFEEGILH